MVKPGELVEQRICGNPALALPSAQGPMGQDGDPVRGAVGRHPAPQMTEVEDAQLHLDGGDVHDLSGLLDLGHTHVRKPDVLDQTVPAEGGEGADARGQRGTRVRGVEQVEEDPIDPECTPAAVAGRGEVARPSVRHPASVRAGEAALGRDPHGGTLALPRAQGTRDEPLVVADVARVEAIGVGGVDQPHPRVEGGVEHLNPAFLVAVRLGGQAHGAHAERPRREPEGAEHGASLTRASRKRAATA